MIHTRCNYFGLTGRRKNWEKAKTFIITNRHATASCIPLDCQLVVHNYLLWFSSSARICCLLFVRGLDQHNKSLKVFEIGVGWLVSFGKSILYLSLKKFASEISFGSLSWKNLLCTTFLGVLKDTAMHLFHSFCLLARERCCMFKFVQFWGHTMGEDENEKRCKFCCEIHFRVMYIKFTLPWVVLFA